MNSGFSWQRDQRQFVIHERIARVRNERMWYAIWGILAALGLVGFAYLIVQSLVLQSSLAGLRDLLVAVKLENLAVWLGLLAGMQLTREYTAYWHEKEPLALGLQADTNETKDISRYYSEKVLRIIDHSFLQDKVWRPWRLLQELFKSSEARQLCVRLGLDLEVLQKKMNAIQLKASITPKQSEVLFRSIMVKALEQAYLNGDNEVHVDDLFVAFLLVPSVARDFLVDQGLKEKEMVGVNSWIHYQKMLVHKQLDESLHSLNRDKHWRNKLWTSTATPILDSVGWDMTLRASRGRPLVGRQEEITRIFEVFSGEGNGVLLVGPHGSGKVQVIESLAHLVVTNQVPPVLADRRIVTVSLAKLLALSTSKLPFKEVAARLVYEISRSGNIIIVLRDLLSIEAAKTDEAAMLIESLLSDVMSDGQVLLMATVDEIDIGKLSGPLGNAMVRVDIPSLGDEDTLLALESMAPYIETKFNVGMTYPALKRAVELSSEFIHDQVQPGKALSLITLAAEYVASQREVYWVNLDDVEKVVVSKTGLPVTQLTGKESDRLLRLEEKISERYVNQVNAVKAVATAIRRARTELTNKRRPIANFLFLGPTGVGKTELARRLADVYFGGQGKMIRMDMTEYQESQSLRNLIGAPLGTGSNEVGRLVEAVRDNPFAVILLDEFEKAHPDVLNIFLQVMDDGRLTSPSGETYDFTHTLIIATSNAGSQVIQDNLREGKSIEDLTEDLKKQELPKYFRPELLNRFDGIIIFETLKFKHVVDIAKLLLTELVDKLAEREINFMITDEALQEVATEGYDPAMGARPLRRLIQDKVEDKIAKLLLAKQVRARDKIILDSGFEVRVEQVKHY